MYDEQYDPYSDALDDLSKVAEVVQYVKKQLALAEDIGVKYDVNYVKAIAFDTINKILFDDIEKAEAKYDEYDYDDDNLPFDEFLSKWGE